jgi:acetyl-CoA C-acetyltransferase
MHMTKHVFGCYSTSPGVLRPPAPVGSPPARPFVATHEGDATVSAYSVVHGRDGAPEWALLVCDLPGGARTYAQVRGSEACAPAEAEEIVGRTVKLRPREVDGPAGRVIVNTATSLR